MRSSWYIATTLLLALPFVAQAALININTADATLLDTLQGIGPTKAAAIVDYRTQHGPFTRIEDIKNVSGIGDSTYAGIQALITVGDTGAMSGPAPAASSTATVAGGSATYVPPPSSLVVHIEGESHALLEVPLRLRVQATTKTGATDASAQFLWSFGDGSSATGSEVEKTYHYAGEYLVVVEARDGSTRARDELTVIASSSKVRIVSTAGEGVTLENSAGETVDLSGWRLLSGGGAFRLPEGLMLFPGKSTLLPFAITNLPLAADVTLTYPSGVVAAAYNSVTVAQPQAADLRYKEVQTSGSTESSVKEKGSVISSTEVTPSTHEEPVIAPEVSPNAGDTSGALSGQAAVGVVRFPRILQSPWTFGLLGVLAVASGAFILL